MRGILTELGSLIKDKKVDLSWLDKKRDFEVDSGDSKPLTNQFKKIFLKKYGSNEDIKEEFVRKYGKPKRM